MKGRDRKVKENKGKRGGKKREAIKERNERKGREEG